MMPAKNKPIKGGGKPLFMTVSQAMVNCLEAEGVETVFGYPGATICPFYDALSRSSIRHILVRTEQNAGHAANGYAWRNQSDYGDFYGLYGFDSYGDYHRAGGV